MRLSSVFLYVLSDIYGSIHLFVLIHFIFQDIFAVLGRYKFQSVIPLI